MAKPNTIAGKKSLVTKVPATNVAAVPTEDEIEERESAFWSANVPAFAPVHTAEREIFRFASAGGVCVWSDKRRIERWKDGSTKVLVAEASYPNGFALDGIVLYFSDDKDLNSVVVSGGVPKKVATFSESIGALDVSKDSIVCALSASAEIVERKGGKPTTVAKGLRSADEIVACRDTVYVYDGVAQTLFELRGSKSSKVATKVDSVSIDLLAHAEHVYWRTPRQGSPFVPQSIVRGLPGGKPEPVFYAWEIRTLDACGDHLYAVLEPSAYSEKTFVVVQMDLAGGNARAVARIPNGQASKMFRADERALWLIQGSTILRVELR